MSTGERLYSIGVLATRLAVGVEELREAARELGIRPAVEINDVPHFRAGDVARLSNALARTAAAR